MTDGKKLRPDLHQLRAEIDRLDRAIHALIQQRAEIVTQVGAAKAQKNSSAGQAPIVYPAREAAILRRLAEAHDGAFPITALLRIWREIIAASVTMQAPFVLAVTDDFQDADGVVAAHFGAGLTLHVDGDPLRAVERGDADAAVMPLPEDQVDAADKPWWLALAALRQQQRDIALLWALPFLPTAGRKCYIVGRGRVADSGADRTWFCVGGPDSDTALLLQAIEQQGYRTLATSAGAWLVEAHGYRAPDDGLLLPGAMSGTDIIWLGAFPEPLCP